MRLSFAGPLELIAVPPRVERVGSVYRAMFVGLCLLAGKRAWRSAAVVETS
jgi:hypothetical protein